MRRHIDALNVEQVLISQSFERPIHHDPGTMDQAIQRACFCRQRLDPGWQFLHAVQIEQPGQVSAAFHFGKCFGELLLIAAGRHHPRPELAEEHRGGLAYPARGAGDQNCFSCEVERIDHSKLKRLT